MKLENLWYKPNIVAWLLRPLSLIYRFIVLIRRSCYRLGLFKSTKLPVPVIVVGNLTTGGAGKTPLVAWLANRLKADGFRPGIVSRGFGGHATVWPQPVTMDSDPRQVGDEPVLLAQRTQCPMFVAPDRVAAAKALLEQHDCNVILCDDGLQHYALQRDIEIAVVDGLRYFGNRFCLPAGPLREPLVRLHQVDFVICNGANEPGWFSMKLEPNAISNVAHPGKQMSIEASLSHQWQALAGIGHPDRFFRQLESLGLSISSKAFPDHHAFSPIDIDYGQESMVMMTEKDAVKCRSFADERHWYLPVTAKVDDQFYDQLLKRLNTLIFP